MPLREMGSLRVRKAGQEILTRTRLLIAFLLPEALLAWNSRLVRLRVLEGASLVFGLANLWGLN